MSSIGNGLVFLGEVSRSLVRLFLVLEARERGLELPAFERGYENSFRIGNSQDLVAGPDFQKLSNLPHQLFLSLCEGARLDAVMSQYRSD